MPSIAFTTPLICKSGEIVISQDTNLLATLGSCIGVVLYEQTSGLYALNHYMLPDPSTSSRNSDLGDLEFGSYSIPYLLDQVRAHSGPRPVIRSWIVGGASQFGVSSDVGQKNIEVAEQILSEMRIPVLGKHVGGNFGRRVEVNLKTNKISIWLLGGVKSKPAPDMIFPIA